MTMTAAMVDALKSGRPRGLLVEIEHPTGTARFCTGVGSRTWNGYTWTGTGTLGTVTPIKQSSEIAIQDIVFRLSGIDADIASRINADVRNLSSTVWLACFDERENVVADPYQLIAPQLDCQRLIVDDDGSTTIEVVAHSGFHTLDRGVEEAWTPENQRTLYPTDTGLDMIPGLQNKDTLWTPVAPE